MGYFRFFYYITYILNFILRLIKRHGKAILWFICIAIFLVICMYNPKSSAVYLGDDTYTDPNNNITKAYENVTLDFIRRFDLYKKQFPNASVLTTFNGYLNALNYRSVYIYYKDKNGAAMLNGAPLKQTTMYVLIYQNNNNISVSADVLHDNYLGLECDVKKLSPVGTQTYIYTVYELSAQNSENSFRLVDNVASEVFYVPSILMNYYSQDFVNYFYNNYTMEEVEILHEMDEKLSNVDETLQQQQEYLEQEPNEEDFSTDDLPTDSGVTATTDSGLNSFFSQIYNVFTGQPNYAQHTIKVPIPFTRKKI